MPSYSFYLPPVLPKWVKDSLYFSEFYCKNH